MVFCHYSPVISKRSLKKTGLILALLLTSFGLTSCAAGGNAETRLIKQVTDGVERDVADLKLRNVKVVALPDGSGTLIAFIVNHNDSPDQLVGVTINGQPADYKSEVILEKNKPMFFEGDSANAKAKVATLNQVPGKRVPVVFYFAKAGKVELSALIVANEGIYSSIL
jgi:copper(I)-binding protein